MKAVNDNRQYGVSALILFVMQPFLGFIRACGRLREPLCGVVFICFYTLFGYAHSFEDVRADAFRKFVNFTHLRPHSFGAVWHEYLMGRVPDPYEHFVMVMVKKFSWNPHVMMAVVGFIGAIFIYMAIRRILKEYHGKHTFWFYILVYFLVSGFSPLSMGGIRQYSMLGIVAYSAYSIILDKKYIWFLPLCITPLIHFAALLYIPVVVVALFIRSIPRSWLFYGAITMCLFGNFMESSGYREAVSHVLGSAGVENEEIKNKTNFYASKGADKAFEKSKTTAISKINGLLSGAFFILCLYVFRKKLRKIDYSGQYDLIWRCYLWFAIVGYGMSGLSVVGARYLFLSSSFSFLLWFKFYSDFPKWKTFKRLIILRCFVSLLGIALHAYNLWCVTFHEIWWAPLPVIIEKGLN